MEYSASSKEKSAASNKARNVRVLGVDDNVALAALLGMMIEDADGLEGVGWLNQADRLLTEIALLLPDVVLLDMSMPGQDPLQVLREVALKFPDVRVLVISGFTQTEYVDRAIEAGAWGYVSKGSDPGNILSAIHKVARGEFVLDVSI